MKHVVSVSLGSATRDKSVTFELGGIEVRAERRGVDGDTAAYNRLMRELDGNVDVLAVGGTEIAFHVDDRVLPFRSTRKLVAGVHQSPLVDGSGLKLTLERRVFELAEPALGAVPHFESAFLNMALDRWGMALAVHEVSDAIVCGDLMFSLGLPVPIRTLAGVKRMATVVVPTVGFLPVKWLYPTGESQTVNEPKFESYFAASDLICGDFLYIGKHAPADLGGKTVLTNTTTAENVDWLGDRGVATLITTTPRFDGRSFGTNLTEAAITAAVGSDRTLTIDELNKAIDEFGIRPEVAQLNS